jgi:hypothetical protein
MLRIVHSADPPAHSAAGAGAISLLLLLKLKAAWADRKKPPATSHQPHQPPGGLDGAS